MNEIINEEYGRGLFALASEEGVDREILLESRAVCEAFSDEYLHLLENPDLPKAERVALVGQLLDGRVNKYLANFVKIMTERGAASEIPGCFAVYERLYNEKHDIRKVTAVSAVPLTDEQKEKLQAKLEKNTGAAVDIEYVVDEKIIGGMRLYFDDRRIDDSIESKLRDIGTRLSDSVV